MWNLKFKDWNLCGALAGAFYDENSTTYHSLTGEVPIIELLDLSQRKVHLVFTWHYINWMQQLKKNNVEVALIIEL